MEMRTNDAYLAGLPLNVLCTFKAFDANGKVVREMSVHSDDFTTDFERFYFNIQAETPDAVRITADIRTGESCGEVSAIQT